MSSWMRGFWRSLCWDSEIMGVKVRNIFKYVKSPELS
jgi:hypothetical protein